MNRPPPAVTPSDTSPPSPERSSKATEPLDVLPALDFSGDEDRTNAPVNLDESSQEDVLNAPPPASRPQRWRAMLDLGWSAIKKWSDDRCSVLSAGIAFYAAFSIAPSLVLVLMVAGWFFGQEAVSGQLYSQLSGLMGDATATQIQDIVAHAHRAGSSGWTTLISIVVLIVGASATFSTLNTALNIVWPYDEEDDSTTAAILNLLKVRLLSFALVLGIAVLLIVTLIADTALTFVGQWLWANSSWSRVGNILQGIVSALVLWVGFAALTKWLPDAPVKWRHAFLGGFISSLLFAMGRKLFALYIAHAGLESSFGAAGALAVLLMWLYFSAAVFLLGSEVGSVCAGHRVSGLITVRAAMKAMRKHHQP